MIFVTDACGVLGHDVEASTESKGCLSGKLAEVVLPTSPFVSMATPWA